MQPALGRAVFLLASAEVVEGLEGEPALPRAELWRTALPRL
jgi:hypothetical protein